MCGWSAVRVCGWVECSEGVCGWSVVRECVVGWSAVGKRVGVECSADMYMDFDQVQLYAPVHNPSHVPLP